MKQKTTVLWFGIFFLMLYADLSPFYLCVHVYVCMAQNIKLILINKWILLLFSLENLRNRHTTRGIAVVVSAGSKFLNNIVAILILSQVLIQFLFLHWSKAREHNLPNYLFYSRRENKLIHNFPKSICVKVNNELGCNLNSACWLHFLCWKLLCNMPLYYYS